MARSFWRSTSKISSILCSVSRTAGRLLHVNYLATFHFILLLNASLVFDFSIQDMFGTKEKICEPVKFSEKFLLNYVSIVLLFLRLLFFVPSESWSCISSEIWEVFTCLCSSTGKASAFPSSTSAESWVSKQSTWIFNYTCCSSFEVLFLSSYQLLAIYYSTKCLLKHDSDPYINSFLSHFHFGSLPLQFWCLTLCLEFFLSLIRNLLYLLCVCWI